MIVAHTMRRLFTTILPHVHTIVKSRCVQKET